MSILLGKVSRNRRRRTMLMDRVPDLRRYFRDIFKIPTTYLAN